MSLIYKYKYSNEIIKDNKKIKQQIVDKKLFIIQHKRFECVTD
jgi:hypothetical protein